MYILCIIEFNHCRHTVQWFLVNFCPFSDSHDSTAYNDSLYTVSPRQPRNLLFLHQSAFSRHFIHIESYSMWFLVPGFYPLAPFWSSSTMQHVWVACSFLLLTGAPSNEFSNAVIPVVASAFPTFLTGNRGNSFPGRWLLWYHSASLLLQPLTIS